MEIRIKDLLKAAEVHVSDTLVLPRIAADSPQVEAIQPVHIEVDAALSKDIVTLTGTVQGEVSYQCSRCLTNFPATVHTELEERFTLSPDKADEDLHAVTGEVIVVNPYVEEALFLALDYRPLCSTACKGLCPTCGVNWNERNCTCDNLAVDPRLAALRDLLSPGNSE